MKNRLFAGLVLAGLAAGAAPLALAQTPMVAGTSGGLDTDEHRSDGSWSPRAMVSKAAWVVDSFEDGNIDGWLPEGTDDCTASKSAVAAFGAYSMRIDGACAHLDGRYLDVSGSKPTGVGVYVRSDTTNTFDTYFVLGDVASGPDGNLGAVFFSGTSTGKWSVFDGTSLDCGPRVPNQWYQVDFVIDWACKMYDVWIDGVLRRSNVSFYHTATESFDKIHVYNWSDTTARYDEITFSTPPISPLIFGDGFERGSACRWSAVTP